MRLTAEQLAACANTTLVRAASWLDEINETITRYEINTNNRVAMFLAQIGHESGSLSRTEENLNYRADRLLAVFPRHFNAQTAQQYAGNPQAIASRVYGNRLGNGPEASGDGWRYRGRGLIQVTGKSNYAEMAYALSMPLVGEPDLLAQPRAAALSAGAFWHARGLNRHADAGQFETTTRIINGGLHGQPDRVLRYKQALSALR